MGTRLCEHVFAFYGEAITLPMDIDWDENPGTAHWGHDLNRFGFLILAEEARVEEVTKMSGLILDWVAKHDQPTRKYSAYAWQNLLNVAIRVENWLRYLDQAARKDQLNLAPQAHHAVRLSIVRQTRILIRWIAEYGLHNNWSVIGLRAAFYVLYGLRDFPHRRPWLAICWRLLDQAIERQILPDGVHQELSPHYHWVVAELLASIQDMARQSGDARGERHAPTLAAMSAFLAALMCPSGRIVSLGDSDADYGARIGAFLASQPATQAPRELFEVREFAYAGLASVRCADTQSLLVFDAGPFGTGHQHEDKLSFWLSAYGKDIVVDPGRYLYERGPEAFYAYLISAHAHSTILVDGLGQNSRAAPELWRATAPGAQIVSQKSDGVALRGAYELGYGPERLPIEHRRSIRAHAAQWEITDAVLGLGAHTIEARFQFHPCAWRLGETAFVGSVGAVNFELRFDPRTWRSARVACGETTPRAGWWSPGLNRIEPAPMLILSTHTDLPFESGVHLRTWRDQSEM